MDKDRNIIAIIQARMDSMRLPGKIMMEISGKPMLWHVVNRLKQCKLIDMVTVATSVEVKDDSVESFCKSNRIHVFRGSEEDVLDRYYRAAEVNRADIIVRITADCPLIDPEVSDKVIAAYLENAADCDSASNTINRTYPRGLDTEVFSFSVLKKIWGEAKKQYHREHVTPYLYEHNDLFKIISVENDKNLSSLRWTVDEIADLEFVKEIYKVLYKKNRIFVMKDILKILEGNVSLKNMNMHIRQKAINK